MCVFIVCCVIALIFYFVSFFFKQKTAYEMRISDWSSDVCSSDLGPRRINRQKPSAERKDLAEGPLSHSTPSPSQTPPKGHPCLSSSAEPSPGLRDRKSVV